MHLILAVEIWALAAVDFAAARHTGIVTYAVRRLFVRLPGSQPALADPISFRHQLVAPENHAMASSDETKIASLLVARVHATYRSSAVNAWTLFGTSA